MTLLLRAVPITAMLIVSAVLAAAGQARTDNRSKPIYFVHGYEGDSGANCNQWDDMTGKFRDWGHSGTFFRVAYYVDDVNCNSWVDHHGSHSTHNASGHSGGSHTANTNIRHLGYHLAWHIYDHYTRYGTYVDVVGHSMGGLIIRYAIAQTELNHPDFPPNVRVEDVVTMGTPHGGFRWPCLFCPLQGDQMSMGSDFLVWLENNAWEPDGYGGTQWSTFGSDNDGWVAADRAAGTGSDRNPVNQYIGSCHKTWYTPVNDIGHTDFLHDTQGGFTAQAYARHCPSGWVFYSGLPWPVRRADFAVTFGDQ
jgi:triacylglycerol esterase/lipase EstA (alpha/beta hydrolase family)